MNRPSQHISEDISRAKAHEYFSRLGWSCNDLHRDYGEDLLVNIFKDSYATPTTFYVQLKSTTAIEKLANKNGDGYSVPIKTELLRKWIQSPIATMILLYDQLNDLFYWDYVQFLLRRKKLRQTKTTSIVIGSHRTFDSTSASEIAGYATRRAEGYQRLSDNLAELEEIFKLDYGFEADLTLNSENILLPQGNFVISGSDQTLYPLGKLREMVQARMNEDPKFNIVKIIKNHINSGTRVHKKLESGKASSLPDPIHGKIRTFHSWSLYLDRVHRSSYST